MIDPFKIQRIIIESLPEHILLAGRAARWLLDRPEQKDAILAYGEGPHEAVFYAKRNKSSISIRQEHSPDSSGGAT